MAKGEVSEKNCNIDIDEIYNTYKKNYYHPPKDISLFIEDARSYGLDYECTSIDTGFLEKLVNLKELVLPDSIIEIKMTPKLKKNS